MINEPYECPHCDTTALIPTTAAGVPMHPCKGLTLMVVPLVRAGTRAETRLIPREDYVGHDDVQRDAEGAVWMAAKTVRDDGEDLAVYAPCAWGNGEGVRS